jgi:hypothetical protein
MTNTRALAVGLALLLGVLSTSLCAQAHRLVTLQRISGSYVITARPLQQRSAVFTNYDDSDAWQGAWTVGLHYRDCHPTQAGYPSHGLPDPGNTEYILFIAHVPHEAIQYSHPVVDRKRFDTPTWQFAAAPKGTFYYKVDVLGGRCGSWSIAATTN